jgi:hypothetical protein
MTPKATQPKQKEEEWLRLLALKYAGGKVLHTKAQKANIQIILERPKDMPIAEYKALRRKQTKDIKNALR